VFIFFAGVAPAAERDCIFMAMGCAVFSPPVTGDNRELSGSCFCRNREILRPEQGFSVPGTGNSTHDFDGFDMVQPSCERVWYNGLTEMGEIGAAQHPDIGKI